MLPHPSIHPVCVLLKFLLLERNICPILYFVVFKGQQSNLLRFELNQSSSSYFVCLLHFVNSRLHSILRFLCFMCYFFCCHLYKLQDQVDTVMQSHWRKNETVLSQQTTTQACPDVDFGKPKRSLYPSQPVLYFLTNCSLDVQQWPWQNHLVDSLISD